MSPAPFCVPSPRRTALAVSVATLTGLAAVTPAAGAASTASRIVYTCAPNLCVVDPDGGGSAPLTTDGATRDYQFPSLSADGKTLAAKRATEVVVGPAAGNLTAVWNTSRDINDVALSPDGTAVAESHSYVVNRFGCPLTGGCLELVDVSEGTWTKGPVSSGTNTFRRFNGGGGVGFLGTSAFLTAAYQIQNDLHTVCVVADPSLVDPPPCAPTSPTQGPGASLGDPAGSPDGKLIAAVKTPDGGASQIVLFDAATGAPVRDLAAGTEPTFSPDGRRIAFQDPTKGISVIATTGGKATRLVGGTSPTWGAGAGPGGGSTGASASVASKSRRYRKQRIAVTVRCAAKTTCRGTLRIKKGTTVLGSRSYSVRAGKSATVSVKPGTAGRRSLLRARQHAVAVRLEPKGGSAVVRKLTLRR